MELLHLREPGGTEVHISLNGHPQRAVSSFQLRESEVPQLLCEPNDPAEELIGPVKFQGIPTPLGIRREKLADHQRVRLVFLRVERWQLLPELLR
jgi:hypothetical protein